MWPRRVQSKMLIKMLGQLIHYFNGRFIFDLYFSFGLKLLDAKPLDRKSKIRL